MIKNINFIIASAILISLTACGSTTTQTNTPTASPESTTTSPAPTAPTTTTEGIIFKEPVKDKLGYIDSLNNSPTVTQTIAPGKTIQLSGWAIAPDGSRPADSVIVTYGDTNTVATTVPVSLARPDVAKTLKKPALEKSGWFAAIDPANLNLTGEKTKIQAWSYNSQTKEAYPLGNSFVIVRKPQ